MDADTVSREIEELEVAAIMQQHRLTVAIEVINDGYAPVGTTVRGTEKLQTI
jgi:hypothetical protein